MIDCTKRAITAYQAEGIAQLLLLRFICKANRLGERRNVGKPRDRELPFIVTDL
jgi:hypothetical protein